MKKAITEATYNFEQIPIRVDKVQEIIDNAPAVDIKDQIAGAYNEGYACGGRESKRQQGEFAEKLKERIEESVCKYCRMNKQCELCEISRVFQIITLTVEERKGGAE